MSEFSLKEDWKYINWKATLITSLYRSIAAGIVWTIIMFFTDVPITTALLYPIGFPAAYFVFFLPLGLLFSTLNRMGVPIVGILGIIFSLCISIGDPVLWIFNKLTKEQFVPVKNLSFVTFSIILFVVDEDKKTAAL